MAEDNWNYLKLFDRNELLELIPPGFTWKTKPWTHQIAAFLANISNDGFLDALDLGTGKTKVAIDTCRYISFINKKKNIKVLYICLNTAVEKMKDEVEKHSNFSAICVRGSKDEKMKLFSTNNNFFIINFEGLRSMLSSRVALSRIGNKKDIRKEIIDEVKIDQFIKKNFDVLIVDESHTIKNSKSLIFRIIKKISHKTKNRFLLTGTPFGNTLLDVWPQYYIIDLGETFNKSFSIFRDSNFEDKGYFGPDWRVTKSGEKYIEHRLYRKAIRYTEDECEELPDKVFRVLKFDLSKEQRTTYNNLFDGKFDDITANVSNKAIVFRQISSGFIKSSDHIFKDNPKLDLLFETIDLVYEKHKVVIFFEFTKSREIVEAILKKRKIKFNSLSGDVKDKYSEYKTFQDNPEYRVMCAQIKSGGASIDLYAATYAIFFEHGGSVIQYKQALKRIHRSGQMQRCFFYSLLGSNTVEIGIYRDLQDGVDAFSRITDAKSAREYIAGR